MSYNPVKKSSGGARSGAGRPKAEKTVQIRVPESLIDQVKKLIDDHKKHSVRHEYKGAQNIAPEFKKDKKLDVKPEKPARIKDRPDFAYYKAEAYKVLNSLTKKERRVQIVAYGSMTKAAEVLATKLLREREQKKACTTSDGLQAQ